MLQQGVRESGVCVLDLVATTCQCNVSVHGMAACRLPTALHIYIHTYMTAAGETGSGSGWVMEPANGFCHPQCMQAADAHAQRRVLA